METKTEYDELQEKVKAFRRRENLKKAKLICPHHDCELEQIGNSWDCSDNGLTTNFQCPQCRRSVNVHIHEKPQSGLTVRVMLEIGIPFIGMAEPLVLVH